MKRLSWFAFFLIFSASCLDEPDCYQLHNDVLGVTFRVIGTGSADSVVLVNNGTPLRGVSYSYTLNYFKEEERINFVQPGKPPNFLSFGYTVKNQFVSEDCGSAFVLSGVHIREHDFDSARVVSSVPSKNGGTNIEIYRCPETDTLTINFNQLYATVTASSTGVTITDKRSSFESHQFNPISTDGAGAVFSERAATVNLPVNLDQNQTIYYFKTETSQDTLFVTYSRKDTALYRPCGIQTFISNVTYRANTFDSLSYGLDEINEEPIRTLQDPHVANLRVFDCPETNIVRVIFKKGTTASSVSIKSVTADYVTGNLSGPVTASAIDLPLNLAANASTFYIQYSDDTIDTLALTYSVTDLTLFKACQDPVIINLRETSDSPDINVVQPTLQYPPVTNVEITVD